MTRDLDQFIQILTGKWKISGKGRVDNIIGEPYHFMAWSQLHLRGDNG